MKIAIIGSGVSGLTAAHMLHKQHDISVFESGSYIGGHVNTIDVEDNGKVLGIDTGFIVFNDWTYPNFDKLIEKLDIKIQNTEMSFSVRCARSDFEWSGSGLKSLIFNSDNWNKTKAYKIFIEMLRFNKLSKTLLLANDFDISLGEFLNRNNFSDEFIHYYILPMGAAIWSSEPNKIREFPAQSFLHFFMNHGLLNLKHRPQWKSIVGGSKQYVTELTIPFKNKIHLNSAVQQVRRVAGRIEIFAKNRSPEYFDHVIFACHSDQALKLIEYPSNDEQNILGGIRFSRNLAILHTDSSLMPKRKSSWSSWNYFVPKKEQSSVTVTYYMNRLQNLKTKKDYFVTLNQKEYLKESDIIKTINYTHPIFDSAAIKAQQKHDLINGIQQTWYCGAYWRNGFHEDGVWSAIQTVNKLNKYIEDEQLYLQRAS